MPDIPTLEPTTLRAGDTWAWTRSLSDYPAGTWTLKYRFKHPALAGFEITATASGTDHAVSVLASTTAGYGAGDWQWIAWVESGAEKYTVDQGTTAIEPDYRTGAATTTLDDRSHARKVLAAIEAVIERRATVDQMKYQIAGRSLDRTPIADLLKLRQRYVTEVANQDAADKMADGIAPGGHILFRF